MGYRKGGADRDGKDGGGARIETAGRLGWWRAWQPLAVLAAVQALGCGRAPSSGDGAQTEKAAIINGTSAAAASTNIAFVSAKILCQASSITQTGSATFLTNDELLTAAHVVAGVSLDKSCDNHLPTADTIMVQFGSQSISAQAVIHPEYKKGNIDIALLHLATPVALNGSSTTGYRRDVSTLTKKQMLGMQTHCFGYGRSDRANPGAKGLLLTADFTIGDGIDGGRDAFGIFKGGGPFASGPGDGRIPFDGDSGGGCLDFTAPANAAVLGVIRDVERRPVCNTNADCPASTPAPTCDVKRHLCSNNDPRYSNIQAADSFRDWVSEHVPGAVPFHKVTGATGAVDDTISLVSSGGLFSIQIDDAFLGRITIPTIISDAPVSSQFPRAFASVSIGDFDQDGLNDLFVLIAGTPFYFNSGGNPFDVSNPSSAFNGTVAVGGTSDVVYSRVRDLNGDKFDDAELVRLDGTSTVLYGGPNGLGAEQAPPSYGPDFDGDGLEDFAVSAPGSDVGVPITNTNDIATVQHDSPGAVDIFYGSGSGRTLFGDNLSAGPPSAPRDGFGGRIAWGNFDADGADELLFLSFGPSGGLHYIDQDADRLIRAADVTDPAFAANFGVPAVGDYDGDGFDDVALSGKGIITLYGGPDGLSKDSRKTSFTAADMGLGDVGFPAFRSGDFNGDGRDDLALVHVTPAGNEVIFVPGSDGGIDPTQGQTINGAALRGSSPQNDDFGLTMVAGNFNGDAYDDLAISADHSSIAIPESGAVFIFYGGPFGLSETGAQIVVPCCGNEFFPEGNTGFGSTLAISRLNQDGYDDLLVGWSNFGGPQDPVLGEGQVFTFAGGPGGLDTLGGQHWGHPPAPFGTRLGGFGQGIGGTSAGFVVIGAPFIANAIPFNNQILAPVGDLTFLGATGLGFDPTLSFTSPPTDYVSQPTCGQTPSCDFPTGTSNLGSLITGPRPGRSPSRAQFPNVGQPQPAAPAPASRFVSFEDPLRGWTSAASLALNYADKTQGRASLKVAASGYLTVDSPPFSTTEWPAVGAKLALDVLVPSVQPSPPWSGDLQISFTAAAAGLNNVPVGSASLGGLVAGAWGKVELALPAAVRAALLGDYPRARFTIAVNRPAGAQPVSLDNLRFTGTMVGRQTFHARVPGGQTAQSPLFGFENLADWTSSQAGLTSSTNRVEGASAVSIPAAGYTVVKSRAFATSEVSGVTSKLALDVFVPSSQPNPSWVGDVQAYFDCPSAGLYNVPLGQASLTNAFFDEYTRVAFTLPAGVVNALKTPHTGCQLSFAVNVGSNGARYLLDALGFLPP